jgi:predicted SnoaL-like aldol condensation-catalyzing enzyme
MRLILFSFSLLVVGFLHGAHAQLSPSDSMRVTEQMISLAPAHAELIAGQTVQVTVAQDQKLLLQYGDPERFLAKKLVYDYWREVWLGKRPELVGNYLSADYIEHNALLPATASAMSAYISDTAEAREIPQEIPELITLIADSDPKDSSVLVLMALRTLYPEPEGSGSYTSTHFEMFRVNDNKITEHWDSWLFRSDAVVPDYASTHGELALATPVKGVHGIAQLDWITSQDPRLFANKRLVFDLWRHIPEGGREELASLFLDPIYIQHNPNAATGREGFVQYFERRPDTAIDPSLEDALVAMLAEGDLVVQVLETQREIGEKTYYVPWFDMFRISDYRVIEHWDTAAKGELPVSMQ